MKIYYKRLLFKLLKNPFTEPLRSFDVSYLEVPFLQTQRGKRYNLGIFLGNIGELGSLYRFDHLLRKRMGSPEWIYKLYNWQLWNWVGEYDSRPNIFIYQGNDIAEMINCIIGHRHVLRNSETVDTFSVPSGLEMEMWKYFKGLIYETLVFDGAYDGPSLCVPGKFFKIQIAKDILSPDHRYRDLFNCEVMFNYYTVDVFLSCTNPYVLPLDSPKNLPALLLE